MSRGRRVAWAVIVVATGLLAPRAPAAHAGEEASPALAERLDRYLRACAAFGFSGAVLVARDGEVVLRRGYGLADRSARRGNDADTLFEIASITKVFTACAVMRLVEEDRIDLDDSIAKHLPGVPEDKHAITIRHLLTHTSGMSRMVAGGGADAAAAVASYLGKPAARPPGERVEYWNGGYALLAALIEEVGGTSFQRFLSREIFTPAGMTRSGFTGDEELPRERQAVGYAGEQAVRAAAEHPYGAYDFRYKGMGGVVASAEDLWRFGRAFLSGEVLEEETVALMQTPFAEHQALGWGVVESARGTPRLVHGGDVRGFHCAFELLPAERGAVVVLSNVEGIPAWKVQWNLQSMLFGEPLRYAVPATPVTGLEDRLGRLAGTYRLEGADARLVVEAEGGALAIGAEGTEAACALSSREADAALEAAIARARALFDAILRGDVAHIEAALPEGVFWAKTWPGHLVETIWPEQVAAWGPLKDVRVIGAAPLERGLVQVVLGLEHERGDRRRQAIYLPDGRLSRLTFDGPRFALRRTVVPTSETTFRTFDWLSDAPLPEVSFEEGKDGRGVLLVRAPSGDTLRFGRTTSDGR